MYTFFQTLFLICTTLPRAIHLIKELGVVSMNDNGYKKFSFVRMMCGLTLHPIWICQILKQVWHCSAYMSTPIAPNKQLGTDTTKNLSQANLQEDRFLQQGTKVLNPGNYPIKVPPPHWWDIGPTEMLCLWVLVIIMMNQQNKGFYYRPVYAEASPGCKKEAYVAAQIGMEMLPY